MTSKGTSERFFNLPGTSIRDMIYKAHQDEVLFSLDELYPLTNALAESAPESFITSPLLRFLFLSSRPIQLSFILLLLLFRYIRWISSTCIAITKSTRPGRRNNSKPYVLLYAPNPSDFFFYNFFSLLPLLVDCSREPRTTVFYTVLSTIGLCIGKLNIIFLFSVCFLCSEMRYCFTVIHTLLHQHRTFLKT